MATPAKSSRRKRHRKWPWITLTVLVVLVVAGWFGVNMYADHWIATHGKDTAALPAIPPFAHAQTVTYTGSLGAWYALPSPGKPTVIIVHGYGSNRADHSSVGVALQQEGYGVMAIDLGYETNASDYGGGTREAKDVEAAVGYALAHGSSRVVLLGYSAGGTASVLAAASGAKVAAVVADSSPVSFIHLASDKVTVPSWVFAPASWFYGLFSNGGSLGTLSSIPASYSVPTLVIQGTADKTVNPSNGPAVVAVTHGTFWRVPGVGHTGTYDKCGADYVSQLTTFYGDALSHSGFVLSPAC